ncbi:MAG: deoxyribodipyrimidine photo-lyase [Phycisphaerales bacterium]
MRTLMWFRSDLRVEDNTALHHACLDEDDGVVAVFNIPTQQWHDHDWGGNKVDFVLRSLRALSDRLSTLNIPLRIVRTERFDTLPDHLLTLARSCGCDALYFNREYEVNERARDEAVADAFDAGAIPVRAFHDQTVLEPDAFRTGAGDFYSVYTPFRRKWQEHYTQGRVQTLAAPRKRSEIDVTSDEIPASLPGFETTYDPDAWPAGEEAAKRRLTAFAKRAIGAYDEQRDPPGEDGTSMLSPHLAIGSISARQCMRSAIEANNDALELTDSGPGVWMSELVWREFYKHVLVGFPRVSRGRAFQRKTEKIEWSYDKEDFSKWCAGQTGFPIVDAGMRQLRQTGWMHNRVRMIVAMFLTKDLFIDWRWGERWFASHLVDLDFASNNGGWQWSASTGTDAQPYFRVFNPWSQSKKCDPDGVYIRRYVPELADVPAVALHDEKKLAEARERLGIDYPTPMVDRTRTKDKVVKAFKAL